MTEQSDTKISAIADAIDALLTAIIAQDHLSLSDFEFSPAGIDELLAASEIELQARKIVADPVGASLRLGIEALGRRLDELGGLAAMSQVLDDVTARDLANEERRTDILDKRFDGIGDWGA